MEHLGQLPEWLHPNPIVLLPISKHQQDYVYEISKKLKEDKIDHIVLDEGSLQSRIKIADNLEIPYRWVFGKKEVESELISVKKFHQEQELIDYYKAIKKI